MTKSTFYSLHTDGDQYRITKFVDGDVESSYLSTETECECPAGHRASCRHRQMIPEMIARGLVNTHWFWNFDRHEAVDFNGSSKALLDNLDQLAEEPKSFLEKWTGVINHEPVGEAQHVEEDTSHIDWDQLAEERLDQTPRPHSPTATTAEFDSADGGSIPPVAAKAKPWRRL